MRLLGIMALSLFVFQAPAWAEEAQLSKSYDACIENSGGVTGQVLDCMINETTVQDARLDQVYKKLIAQLPPPRQADLKEAQNAWIKFRDSYAKYLDDTDGGTMAAISKADWILTSTAIQADRIQSQLEE